MRILVIEDESELRAQLRDRLSANGWIVVTAADGEEGYYQASEQKFDVAVIDLGLPGISGMDVIRRIRADGRSLPILILTARNRWQDKVDGLEAGADDYLVKPFHVEELIARVRALARRNAGWTSTVLQCGPYELDTRAQKLTVEGRETELTAYEYRLLELLMLHTGKVVARDSIAEHLYDEELERDSNVIEVLVARLRRKLDPANTLHPIETVRGQGYRFTLGNPA